MRPFTEKILNILLDRWLIPRTMNGIGSPTILHRTKRFVILMEVRPKTSNNQTKGIK